MFAAHRHAERRILTAVHDAGFTDLTLAQARLTAHLADGGSRLTDLAEAAGVTKQTAHVLVEQLIENRYVTRTPDPEDRRARLITLAERGELARKAARRAEAAIVRDWERHLGATDLARLTDLLTRLAASTPLDT